MALSAICNASSGTTERGDSGSHCSTNSDGNALGLQSGRGSGGSHKQVRRAPAKDIWQHSAWGTGEGSVWLVAQCTSGHLEP